jgi:hypothetical protein
MKLPSRSLAAPNVAEDLGAWYYLPSAFAQAAAGQARCPLGRKDSHENMTFSRTDPFRTPLRARFDLSPAPCQWYPLLMTIAVAKDVEEFLQEQVRAGVAGDPSELANDVLRCVRDQQRRPFEITPQLEAWLLESADQPATPLTKADFDGIRQRAQKHDSPSRG